MNQINANGLLVKMQQLAELAKTDNGSINNPVAINNKNDNFVSMLEQAMATVNELQLESGKLATEFENGKQDVSLAQVMIASQKSSVAFQAVTQVRNRLISAYQDVMNMPM